MTPYVEVADPPNRLSRRRVAGLAVAAAVLAVIAVARTIDADATVGWLRDAGPAGALALAVAYVLVSFAALPVGVLTIAAGWAYGVGWGMAVIVPVAVCASVACFGVGRTVLRAPIERRVRRDHRFAAIDRAIGAEGFRVTLLMRLSPILPFGALNYALAASSVRPASYIAATAIGIAPATLLYVYLGALAGGGSSGDGVSGAATWCGIAATVLAIGVIVRAAKRALGAAEPAS